jgi:central glycolytic genes regulator
MQLDLSVLETVAPDVLDVLQQRFLILRNIYWMQPVGRRLLAEKIGLTERVLRSQADILRDLQLLHISKSGMILTKAGVNSVQNLEKMMDVLQGFHLMENKLKSYFGIRKITIVAGDSDVQKKILEEFGSVVTQVLDDLLPDGENIIATMGGTTMSVVAANLSKLETKMRHNIFVPARGGIGEAISVQANSVSEKMAQHAGGKHRTLYVPEHVRQETYELLIEEPAIQEVLQLVKQANCVIHSIGLALHMAARRKMTKEEIIKIKQLGAVAESFGYFFNKEGMVVYKLPRIGLKLSQLETIPVILAVAGGKGKAQAIHAYMKNAPKKTWLITDEAAACEILKMIG